MAEAILNAPRFRDDEAARKHLESIRWPDGPICPHCGAFERISPLNGETHRAGLYFCGDCREQFTVTVGTVFERSKIPLHKWVLATHLLCASKKGMSSKQIERMLGVTYKTAWFMTHRIREAMKPAYKGKLGSNGGTVEADETFWGNSKRSKKGRAYKGRGYEHKEKIFALVERGGDVRAFHVSAINSKTLKPILLAQMAKDAHLMTDEAHTYIGIGKEFASHDVVKHGKGEYSRGKAHTNTVEGYFSLLKRGLIGTYHHVGEQHLQRYVSEFDFRYNRREITDSERADSALKGISGKRLTYRRINSQA